MAMRAKRLLIEEYESNDADFFLKLMEKTTDGMDIGQESKLDRLFEN